MIEIIIGSIGIVILFVIFYGNYDKKKNIFYNIFFPLILGSVFSFGICFLLYFGIGLPILKIKCSDYTSNIKINTYNIYSIRNNDTLEGNFYIGGFFIYMHGEGEIKTVEKYYTYIKNNDGNLVRKYFKSSDTEIIMKDNNKYIEEWNSYTYIKPGIWSIYPIHSVSSKNFYKLYIPSNSIIENIDIK